MLRVIVEAWGGEEGGRTETEGRVVNTVFTIMVINLLEQPRFHFKATDKPPKKANFESRHKLSSSDKMTINTTTTATAAAARNQGGCRWKIQRRR